MREKKTKPSSFDGFPSSNQIHRQRMADHHHGVSPESFDLVPYDEYNAARPREGRHIMASQRGPSGTRDGADPFWSETVVVYQAFNPAIADAIVGAQRHLGAVDAGFLPERMTWIKTSFLWMMHRSQWAGKKNQVGWLGFFFFFFWLLWGRRWGFVCLGCLAI